MSHEDVASQPPDDSARPPALQRRTDPLHRIEVERAAAAREALAAQRLIDEFISQARDLGIEPEPLRMHLSGGGTARTDKKGWYIKANQTVAIGEDGGYYVLSMPGGIRERLTGVRLNPTQPALDVSRGGRDGETGDLADFLTKRLHRPQPNESPGQ